MNQVFGLVFQLFFHYISEPLHLFFHRHAAVVELHGIVGLPERGDLPGGVDAVAVADVLFDLLQAVLLSFFQQFPVPPAGPGVHVGGQEDLDVRARKDDGPDVPPVHHHAPVFSETSLDGHELFPDLADLADGTHTIGYFDRPDLVFDVFPVQERFVFLFLRIEPEIDVDPVQRSGQRFLVDTPRPGHAVPEGKKGDRPVHGAAVDVGEAQLFRDGFGEGALSAGTAAVDRDEQPAGGCAHNILLKSAEKSVLREKWFVAPARW